MPIETWLNRSWSPATYFINLSIYLFRDFHKAYNKYFLSSRLNPLSPSIHIQILQTNLHTFPLRISWENLIKHQGIFSFVIIFYILTTLSLDNVWTLLGENCCWSLLGLKGLIRDLNRTDSGSGEVDVKDNKSKLNNQQ